MLSKLKAKMFEAFAAWCINRAMRTPHEHLFHDAGKPHVHRYWLLRIGSKTPNGDGEIHPWFSVRVNNIVSNEEPIFHDEPCHTTTIVLRGALCEVVPIEKERWVIHITTVRQYHGQDPVEYNTDHALHFGPGDVLRRKAWDWHFFRLPEGNEAWTLTISGHKRQMWGYLVDGLVKVPAARFWQARRERANSNSGRVR